MFFRVCPSSTRMLPVCDPYVAVCFNSHDIYSMPRNTFCQFVTDAAAQPET